MERGPVIVHGSEGRLIRPYGSHAAQQLEPAQRVFLGAVRAGGVGGSVVKRVVEAHPPVKLEEGLHLPDELLDLRGAGGGGGKEGRRGGEDCVECRKEGEGTRMERGGRRTCWVTEERRGWEGGG